MAKNKHPAVASRPAFNKTPFGGVPAPTSRGAKKADQSELLPGRKALNQLSKPNTSIQDFGRLTPIGSGAWNTDFLTNPKTSF